MKPGAPSLFRFSSSRLLNKLLGRADKEESNGCSLTDPRQRRDLFISHDVIHEDGRTSGDFWAAADVEFQEELLSADAQ